MKTNLFSKVAVTMMTVALGAGVVGSISGTVAWFQYSTRSTVAFTGTSAHCTENLQIRLYKQGQEAEAGWASDIDADAIAGAIKGVVAKYQAPTSDPATDVTVVANTFYGQFTHGGEYKFVYQDAKWYLNGAEVSLGTYGITAPESPANGGYIRVIANAFDTVHPVTSGELAEGAIAADLYRNPLYQYPDQGDWKKAEKSDFVTIPLELRVKDVNGSTPAQLAKNIYVSRMNMAVQPVEGKGDITSALRVAVRASADDGEHWTDYGTFSKDGIAVDTYGNLDLNNDGSDDKFGDFSWEKENSGKILYGHQHGEATISVGSGSLTNPTIKTDWFIGKNGTNPGSYTFTYDGISAKSWTLSGASVKLADYGISVEGTPSNTNTLQVSVPDTSETHTNTADSFNLDAVATPVKGIADDSDPYAIIGQPIGTTSATKNLRVELKVYLEGWQKLGATPSALWDAATYIGSQFNVGVRFSADAHTDH